MARLAIGRRSSGSRGGVERAHRYGGSPQERSGRCRRLNSGRLDRDQRSRPAIAASAVQSLDRSQRIRCLSRLRMADADTAVEAGVESVWVPSDEGMFDERAAAVRSTSSCRTYRAQALQVHRWNRSRRDAPKPMGRSSRCEASRTIPRQWGRDAASRRANPRNPH